MDAEDARVLDADIGRRPRPVPRAEEESPAGGWATTLKMNATRLLLIVGFLALWQLTSGRLIAEFWVSKPSVVGDRLLEWVRSGYLFFHLGITLQEMFWGFVVGASTGIAAGFILGGNPFLGRLMDPLITAVYALPKIALAPLFVLWFGIGLQMKVALSATIVFFLVFWNTYAGVRDVDRELVDVLRVIGARRKHLVLKVVLPQALTWIYVGLKLSVPYALIGAVVGELIASNRGLGYVLQNSAGQFDTAGVFAALFVLMMISTALNELLDRSEASVLRWKTAGR